jgi:carbohydrate diacid regulator
VTPGEALEAIKRCTMHRKEDLSWVTPEDAVLVFKTIDLAEGGLVSDYEAAVEAYVEAAIVSIQSRSSSSEPFRVYAGGMQMDFSRYRAAYRQVLWLADRFRDSETRISYFYRHVGDFLWSRIPRSELMDTFESLSRLLPANGAVEFRSSVEALAESAFNAKEAAARLGVHRNTLAARLTRLQATFGVDPRGDPCARELLTLLARYLEPPTG